MSAFPAQPLVGSTSRSRAGRALLAASAVYPVAWIAGLGVPAPAVEVDAGAAEVLAGHVGLAGGVAVRAVLVHGVAAIALAVVALALAAAVRRTGEHRVGRVLGVAGLGAAGLSFVQLGAELILSAIAIPDRDAPLAHTLFEVVNRVDGVKMLALAAMAAAGVVAIRRTSVLPGRLAPVGVALVVSLVASAAGYLFAAPPLALAAFVSLPLLLVWVAWAGVALARSGR